MDYEKTRLTPETEKPEKDMTAARKEARRQIERNRQQTGQFKKKYFEYYDDVKINHREDW